MGGRGDLLDIPSQFLWWIIWGNQRRNLNPYSPPPLLPCHSHCHQSTDPLKCKRPGERKEMGRSSARPRALHPPLGCRGEEEQV